MKERQKMMLRHMLLSEKALLIDDLAAEFSIGRRTVSRDLDALDGWLSLRGSRLERKQNHGIKVLSFGNSVDELLRLLNKPESFLESLSPEVRKKHILLYLLYNNREVKISEIAQIFFISDTSVWNDLNIIQEELADEALELQRLKGVGIRLTGKEPVVRLKFIETLSTIFSAGTIVPYLYSIKEDKNHSLEVNQFKLLLKKLNFPESSVRIHDLIHAVTDDLGYRFTMSGEALLYFYLQLTFHRIKSEALVRETPDFQTLQQLTKISVKALKTLTEPIFSGEIPEGEVKLLALVLQVLEVGDITTVKSAIHKEIITKPVKEFTQSIIKEFSAIDNRLYYLNEHIESVISFAVSSLITRLTFKIPYWHGEWGTSSSEEWDKDEKEKVLSEMFFKKFSLQPGKGDLENILLHFYSMVLNARDLPRRKIRCMVCCFEGIGLAAYLQSILQRELKNIKIIEATAVYKIQQDYLDSNEIELVISTFSLNHLTTPVVPISLPLNKTKLKADISKAVRKINRFENKLPIKKGNEDVFEFNKLMDFITNFNFFNFPDLDHNEIINLLSENLNSDGDAAKSISISFKKREDLGPLFFDEYGIRVLHCKSEATTIPRAGVINFEDSDRPRMLFMVAPSPCPDSIRKMLSVITISFLENRLFREAIMKGTINDIRKNLMDIYKEII